MTDAPDNLATRLFLAVKPFVYSADEHNVLNAIAVALAQPMPADHLLRAMAEAHDQEEAAQRGEPSPWRLNGEQPDPDFVRDRLAAMRSAFEAVGTHGLAGQLAADGALLLAWDKFELGSVEAPPPPLNHAVLGYRLLFAAVALEGRSDPWLLADRPDGSSVRLEAHKGLNDPWDQLTLLFTDSAGVQRLRDYPGGQYYPRRAPASESASFTSAATAGLAPGRANAVYEEGPVRPALDPEADHATTCLTDGSPVTADHRQLLPNGQQKGYVVLNEDQRKRGFVRPYRDVYRHLTCGKTTRMQRPIAETYARRPAFYSGTFCSHCMGHFPIGEAGEFVWIEQNGSDGPKVGT